MQIKITDDLTIIKTTIKERILDYIVLRIVKIICKLGYIFYIRNSIDHPDFNGDDIAIFEGLQDYNYNTRLIAISYWGLRKKNIKEYTLITKI